MICAVSSGADSMAMLWCLHCLQSELSIRVEAAHFNHRLRGAESDRDEAFVREFCASHGIALTVGAANPEDYEDDPFVFPHEVMVLQHIRNKRLDAVLKALKDAGVPQVHYKSVVTPFNTLWTLRRLCETMQKEHAAMIEMEEVKEKKKQEAAGDGDE